MLYLQPQNKQMTCNSLDRYMRIKERQWFRHELFICGPISFSMQVQDLQDPMNIEHFDMEHIFRLWELLCMFAFTFPICKHRTDINSYSRLIDELCDLIILQTKSASYARMATWEQWKVWNMFLLQYLASNTLLFHHCYSECLEMLTFVDVDLYGIRAKLPLHLLPWITPPIRNVPTYFHPLTYDTTFPNFNILTTKQRTTYP